MQLDETCWKDIFQQKQESERNYENESESRQERTLVATISREVTFVLPPRFEASPSHLKSV